MLYVINVGYRKLNVVSNDVTFAARQKKNIAMGSKHVISLIPFISLPF
jgi:hypothetical protein